MCVLNARGWGTHQREGRRSQQFIPGCGVVFSIEVTFRIDGREVSSERFAYQFARHALRKVLHDVLLGLVSAGTPITHPRHDDSRRN